MKIVVFIYSMHGGGAERVTANLANEWAALGWEVTVVTLTAGEGDVYPFHPGVKRIELGLAGGVEGGGLVRTLMSNVKRVLAFRKVLRETKPTVALGVMATANVLAVLAGIGLPYKIIASEHTHPPRAPLTPFWERLRLLTYRFADKVVALTDETREWIETHCRCTDVKVIPPPFTLPIARTNPVIEPKSVVRDERRLLLAVGRLSPEKGFDSLIDAFRKIAGALPQWDLVIVGEGLARASLERRVDEAKLRGRVFLPGRAGNVADWYERADLYVLSSHFEGFSMTLVEAMASGCAAVSYDCDSGPRVIVTHGTNGLLVNPVGDASALAKSLETLMRDDAERHRMALRASSVNETFALPKTIALWQEVFEESGVKVPRGASLRVPVAGR
ncbi:glycosyl transferase [Caballeronia glebae]|jgi:glycosyltransferase involved in cell wall biosynthesis|uniref:Glycosyl transferase n=1 Tax=Caballeronia glebae TaxID=1777143 RepID=A0A158BDU4_9BURK|nr:glycosyltransferase family 4 protein [Caballeronia glebae]SAK68231.1 glycosyl transferase [Caballeronia glebae]